MFDLPNYLRVYIFHRKDTRRHDPGLSGVPGEVCRLFTFYVGSAAVVPVDLRSADHRDRWIFRVEVFPGLGSLLRDKTPGFRVGNTPRVWRRKGPVETARVSRVVASVPCRWTRT